MIVGIVGIFKKSILKKLLGFLKIKGLKYLLRGDCLVFFSIS